VLQPSADYVRNTVGRHSSITADKHFEGTPELRSVQDRFMVEL
jgi:hypothetical protein